MSNQQDRHSSAHEENDFLTEESIDNFATEASEVEETKSSTETPWAGNYEPLETGYIYVTDSDRAALGNDEDESLSQQLFINANRVEKRSFKEVLEDYNYQRVLEKEQAREAEIVAGIEAMRAEKARVAERERMGLPPEEYEEEKDSKKPLVVGAIALGGLLLCGGIIIAAITTSHSQTVHEADFAVSSAIPSATAAEAEGIAPTPSFNSQSPEVNYIESSQPAITPGTVEYVTSAAAEEAPIQEQVYPAQQYSAPVEEEIDTAEASQPALQTVEATETNEVAEPTAVATSQNSLDSNSTVTENPVADPEPENTAG